MMKKKQNLKENLRKEVRKKMKSFKETQFYKKLEFTVTILLILGFLTDIGITLYMTYKDERFAYTFFFGLAFILPAVLITRDIFKEKMQAYKKECLDKVTDARKAQAKAEKQHLEDVDNLAEADAAIDDYENRENQLLDTQKRLSLSLEYYSMYEDTYYKWIQYINARNFASLCWTRKEYLELFNPLLYATNKKYRDAVDAESPTWIEWIKNPNWDVSYTVDYINRELNKIIESSKRKPSNFSSDIRELDRAKEIPKKITKSKETVNRDDDGGR